MGHFLGYGNIGIKKTDGVASFTVANKFDKAKEIVSIVNELVHINKTSVKKVEVVNNTSVSNPAISNVNIVDKLKKLSDLKNNGTINDDEFDALKRKLLN